MTDTTMLEVQTARETHRKNSESSIKDLTEPEGPFRLKDKVSQVCQILQSVRSVHTPALCGLYDHQPFEVTES